MQSGPPALRLRPCRPRAQTKLKWAHVYEVAEPYHTEALWAAEEIKKRTNGKYEIQVFPASQLGNENQINEGLGLATVDMIYTGVAFAGSIHKPIAITNAPYVLRDFEHWKAYRDSKLFRDIAKGYEDKTRHKVDRADLLRPAHVTANKEIKKPEDMKGMKLRVPPAPLFLMFTKSVGANATPIAFAEVYLALQQGTVDGQENPLPTIMAKKFYEVQIAHHADRPHHRVAADDRRHACLGKLSDAEKKIFEEVLIQAAATRHRPDPRLRAEARRRAPQARQDRGRGRPRSLPQGRDAAAQRPGRRRRLEPGRVRRAAGAVSLSPLPPCGERASCRGHEASPKGEGEGRGVAPLPPGLTARLCRVASPRRRERRGAQPLAQRGHRGT